MKKIILKFSTLFLAILFTQNLNAQAISAAGALGWAVPGGSGVSDKMEDLNLDGGLTYFGDIMYHLDSKIGFGLHYQGSILAGVGGGDTDIFGMRFIGAKGQYTFLEGNFEPFVGLGLGLSQLLTPELSITDGNGMTTLVPENRSSNIGILPEVGFYVKNFFLSVQYLVPVNYTVEEVNIVSKALGTVNINVGYRYKYEW